MQLAQLKLTIRGLFLALGVAGLVSCGSGDEAGGGGACGGAEDTGLCLFVTDIVVSDVDAGPDIDHTQLGDCNLDGTFDDPEDFVVARVEITFGLSQVGPAPTGATRVLLTNYSVTYAPVFPAGAVAISPLINAGLGQGVSVDVGGTTTTLVDILDFAQKAQVALGPDATYTATFVFSGEDDFGESVDVAVRAQFDTANYNNC